MVRTIVSGGVGGMSLWIVIFPFDVVKSRMQVHGTNLPMVSLLMKVAREEGTLYVPRLLSCHCSFHLTAELCL